MNQIVQRNLSDLEYRYGTWGVKRLLQMIIQEENSWKIKAELGLSLCAIGLLRSNLPMLLRLTEEKKANLRLAYSKPLAA